MERTGQQPELMQDDCRELSRWLATRPGARRIAMEAAMEIEIGDSAPRRPAPKPVTTVEELAALDENTVVRGYMAGLRNAADFAERDRGYWHGYLNGMVDGGHAKTSADQMELARAVVRSKTLNV